MRNAQVRQVYTILKKEAVQRRYKKLSEIDNQGKKYTTDVKYKKISAEFYISEGTVLNYISANTKETRTQFTIEQQELLKELEERTRKYGSNNRA